MREILRQIRPNFGVGTAGLIPDAPWRQIAVASAVASIVGIALFSGTWPGSPTELRSMLNTGVAVTMNVAVLLTQLWLQWPAQEMFGK